MAGQVLKSMMNSNELPFTLYVVGSVIEEDADGYPLFHLIQNENIKPDYVLLGEPTDLQVYRGQRGRMEIKITTTGKSAHGAHNQQGVNAVYKMTPIISAIEQLDKNLPIVEPLGKGSITVSQVVTRAPSLCSVPDFCEIHLDRRLTLGETRESALLQLQNLVEKLKVDASISIPIFEGKSWKGTEFQQETYYPTWLLDEDDVLTRAGMKTASTVLDAAARLGSWAFSTNGVATAGNFGIPTIGFAPGKEELSHSSREELNLADLLTATKFYTLFPFALSELIRNMNDQ
ncbi:MAG: M20/M25/M40 family metallo-hydrolase, partial [bacterium]|nr:M20/M25/M40 family metallo-hydrolase [bacterium]